MSETDILTGGGAAESAADTRPRGTLPERCYACAAPVRGPYCWACGQKNDDCRRSVFSLAGESVRDIASLEGRFLRTLRAVVTRPGRHLREYGRGVRSPYSPPIRFFLVISFLFFTTLWVTDRQIVAFQPEVHVEDGQVKIDEWAGGFFVRPRDITYSAEERAAMLGAVEAGTASEEVAVAVLREEAEAEIAGLRAEAEADIAGIAASGGPDASTLAAERAAEAEAAVQEVRTRLVEDLADIAPGEAGREVVHMVQDELRAEGLAPPVVADARAGPGEAAGEADGSDDLTLNGRTIERERLRDGLFRLAENPRLFNTALAEWIPRIMVLMIPLMALLGAAFVRGPDALLYDHAVLSLNTHAVAFGLMTLGIWTAGFLPGWLFGSAAFLGVPFYYYRAMRGAFGRRRRKLIPATLVVFGVYGLVLATALTSAAINAFAGTL